MGASGEAGQGFIFGPVHERCIQSLADAGEPAEFAAWQHAGLRWRRFEGFICWRPFEWEFDFEDEAVHSARMPLEASE